MEPIVRGGFGDVEFCKELTREHPPLRDIRIKRVVKPRLRDGIALRFGGVFRLVCAIP
jgi:hypothetical protein